jgi:hypothetical protein
MSTQPTAHTTPEPAEHLLAEFHVTRLRIHLRIDRASRFPPFAGSLFRGLLGWGLKDLVCAFRPDTRCEECHLRTSCAYPSLFEPALATVTTHDLDHDTVAPPFALGVAPQMAAALPAGGVVSFDVSLFGSAALHAATFAQAVTAASSRRRPLGMTGSTFSVDRLEVATGADSWEPFHPAAPQPLARIALPVDGLVESEGVAAGDELRLQFVTPLRLKAENRVVGWPEFGVLIDRLADRAARLLSAYHGYTWNVQRRAFTAEAQTVELVDGGSVRRRAVRRYSNRQETSIDLPGVEGVATYHGPFHDYLPLLRLGEFMHVGKNTTAGFGRIRVLS